VADGLDLIWQTAKGRGKHFDKVPIVDVVGEDSAAA